MEQFVRFTEQQYDLSLQEECVNVEENDYIPPVKENDTVSFIVEKSTVDYRGDTTSDLKVALTNCGVLVAEDIGMIEEGENQFYVTATIPEGLTDCDYELVIYSVFETADCSGFAGSTLQSVIDDNIILGDILECTLNDFL